jgi:superfamily II DNA or RNA helicase
MVMGINAVTKDLIERLNVNDQDLMGIDIIVSFIKLSGYKQLEPMLKDALRRSIPVRVLTSTYMNVTEPAALSELYNLLGEGNVRLYNGRAPSFHPKAYFFKSKEKYQSYVLVGSSNISRVALTNGIEWNYQVEASVDQDSYDYYMEQFEYLFKYDSYKLDVEKISEYRKTLILPDAERKISRINEHYNKYRQNNNYKKRLSNLFKPNQSQTEALIELKRTKNEGNDKALVVVATGVGKTFLAAFDSMDYISVLFVAHREEILNQAYDTFAKVRGSEDLGRFFNGYQEVDKKVVFASVQSLSRKEHITKFESNNFEYVVIDEFHHASSPSYKRIIDYFKPIFLLGLTATPHRLDRKDVFEICDYNVAYETDLFSAINRDWLAPFRYYGIYDGTVDYGKVRYINGRYVEEELSKAVSTDDRSKLIFKHYMKHQRKHTMAFCSSIEHAEYMADYFNSNGIKSVTIHSQISRKYCADRTIGIEKFITGEIEVIFSVDMLNESVDIPAIDLILLLRPTESPTVFFQQLGRGLRHSAGKRNLKVLDFIGNYKNVEMIPFWLSGEVTTDSKKKEEVIKKLIDQENIPVDCYIDFDFEVVNIFKEMIHKKVKIIDEIKELYVSCKEELGHIPSRMEFFESLSDIQYRSIKAQSKANPFNKYLDFLSTMEPGYLSGDFINSDAHKFINMLETTGMSKLYKMPILLAFYNKGTFKMKINKDEVCQNFNEFYHNERNAVDLDRHKNTNSYKTWIKNDYWKLALDNPIHFLCKTHDDIFEFDAKTETMSIKLNLAPSLKDDFFLSQVEDAIHFRRSNFLDQLLSNKEKKS